MRPDLRCCDTCAFATGETSIKFHCGEDLKFWEPAVATATAPAHRRSVRGWFYDTFGALTLRYHLPLTFPTASSTSKPRNQQSMMMREILADKFTSNLRQLRESGAVRHTATEIHGFFEDYRWLSNFHLCPVLYEGVMYPSSENAYQAAKYNKDDTVQVRKMCDGKPAYVLESTRTHIAAVSPSQSKKLGQLAEMDPELWYLQKKEVMREILADKFTRNLDLRQKLIDTGTAHLEETNWWGDTTWGVCKGTGKNWLGELLMDIRDNLNTVIG